MISLELSTILHNSLQSAIINAQIDEFLRHGGVISEAPLLVPVPRPYGRHSASTIAKRSKPKEASKPGRPSRTYDAELVDRIAMMGQTMTCNQVSKALNISVNKLHCLSMRNGFRFQSESMSDRRNYEADRPKVERIKAFIELGISRKQAAERMGVSANQLNRLLRDYDLEFPRCVGGKTWVMPA